jgi:two-component system, NarL family, sensor histidine kinase UhpB
MSLRVRLIMSIMIVLLVSLGVGGAAAGWHAVRSVRAEMQAALAVGAQTLRNGIYELPRARDPENELERLVRNFDGDRHIRAELRDATRELHVASALPVVASNMPAWFIALLAPSIAPVRFDVGAGDTVTVAPDPRNEIGEVWTQLRDDLVAVGLSCGLSIVLVSLVVGRALRPLDRLSAALASVGSEGYAVRVEHAGPPELVRLAEGFNAMMERLDAAQARNLRLNEQLLTLREEERTDLARDLHDEIGPFLFAVNLDAASIERAASSGGIAEVPERAHAIREAVEHMQSHVRAMLHRLRPANPVEAGLAPALGNLVAFWRARQPEIDFTLAMAVDEHRLGDPPMAAIYRLVQEGLNNAVRHGCPRRIAIVVEAADDGEVIVRVADNGTGLTAANVPGLGLKGMRERIEGLGGTLHVGAERDGKGLVVTARLPCAAVREAA